MTQTNINNQPNVNNSSVVLAAQPSEMGVREMSSLEIAELTGKQHAHVMRDIRALLEQGVSESNFGLSSYKQSQPNGGYKEVPCYNLTKKGSLILASGYNAVLREKIIDRWEALETGQAVPMYQQPKNPTPNNLFSVQEQFQVIELASSTLKMTKSDKESMVSQVLSQYGLTLPVQNKEGAYILSADQLLKHHGIRLSTIAFNRLMQQHGYIEYRVRNTSKTKSGKSSYAALSPKGEKWGQNKDSKYCENKQDIFYYVKTFPQLLQELNLS